MKPGFLVLLIASTAFGQSSPAVPTAACGPGDTSFAVKLDSALHAMKAPEPGMARLYFIQDRGEGMGGIAFAYPTTRIGIDGRWVGATKSSSYFSVSVEPGLHHICAAMQSSLYFENIELRHLTAEAGASYYFRTRILLTRDQEYLELTPLDSDEGEYLAGSFPLAAARAKR